MMMMMMIYIATSLGRGLVSDDGVGSLRLTRRRDPGPRPTKGFVPLYSGPAVGTDDGAWWSEWSPTKGPAAGGGEHSLMTGQAARLRDWAPDSLAWRECDP